jgi:CBS domain-containing protein
MQVQTTDSRPRAPESLVAGQRVRDVMRRDFITIALRESVLEALHLMRLARLRQLVVEDEGRLVGVLSYRDLQDELLTRIGVGTAARTPSPLARVPVSERMASEPYSISQDATLGEAAARLARLRVGCLPVVEPADAGLRLVGLLTEMDLLRAAYGL